MKDRLSILDVAASAAHLVVLIEDPKTGFRSHGAGPEFHDGFRILRAQCEALGLLHEYRRDRLGRYVLPGAMTASQARRDDPAH